MRKLFHWLLTTGSVLSAAAAGAGDFQLLEQVHAAAADYAAAQAPAGSAIAVAPLDQRLRLPQCSTPLAAVASNATSSAINVAVRCDNPQWTVYVPVRVTPRQTVVVLRRAVTRGETLSADDVSLETRDIVNGYGSFADTRQVIGKTLRRPLMAGSVLVPDALAAAVLVRRGELVTLVGRAGAMEVRTQAKAMGDGSEGQAIQVQNTASGRLVGAVVRAAGLVEVNL